MGDQSKFDVAIIGGGPGGYVAAIRLAQLGKKVALIEKRSTLGGTCLNVGCVPTKALLDATHRYEIIKEKSAEVGISIQSHSIDIDTMMGFKENVVSETVSGVDFLMKKNKIERYTGSGRVIEPGKIEVTGGPDNHFIEADKIVLATGSEPVELPFAPFDGKKILSSDHAIALKKPPAHLLVIGAGVIGLELGTVWKRLGSRVSIVEMMPSIFPGTDRQIMMGAQRSYTSNTGLEFYFDTRVENVTIEGENVLVSTVNSKGEKIVLKGDTLLVAVGRKPVLHGSGADQLGLKLTPDGKIDVDPENYETSVPGIYAIGDIIPGPMLAHKAEEEGIILAEKLAGIKTSLDYNAIPSIVYTHPELSWVGKGEDQLKSEGVEYNAGRALFRANARAKAMGESEGMVKLLSNKNDNRLLGAFILGPHSSELIAELVIAIRKNYTLEEIVHTIHGHPTLSEVIKEAALDGLKRAIHS